MIAPVDDMQRPSGSEDHARAAGTRTGAAGGPWWRLSWPVRNAPVAVSSEPAGTPPSGSTPGTAAQDEPGTSPPASEPVEPDDLPDDVIPLTPELVEEDAQRNDFVLRLAVVLLAFLLGLTEIGETQTLVHVRTGQYQASHGLLPPRTDVFSYTAAEHPWANLSWLFDLILAGVYGLGSGIGLTLLKAALAAVTFWYVVHTRRWGVSTWWGSVCAGLALLVCFPQLTALPAIVTLLGAALVLWLLNRWEQGGSRRNLWLIVAIIAVWSNLDPRAFVGVLLVVLYALGSVADWLLGRGGTRDPAHVRTLGIAAAASILAAMLNPFLWQSLWAPVPLYADVYPAWRTYYQVPTSVKELEAFRLIDATWWRAFAASSIARLITIASFSLAAAAIVTMVLNWRRVRMAHVAVFLAFAGLAIAGTHELAVASLVWCVLANLNAQEWYRNTFRQTYSIDFSERLFSTGGRFVSVVGLLAIAWLAVSGELAGQTGNRTGFGFRQTLRAEIDGLADDLGKVSDGERLFNSEPEQGDLMIWLNRRPFIDSRLALYADGGQQEVLAQHLQTRNALRPYAPAVPHSGDRGVWQTVFEAHDIEAVLVPLTGRYPFYELYWELRAAPDFRLTELGSAAAVFTWTSGSSASQATVAPVDMIAAAFRPESAPEIPTRYDSAHPRSLYERWFNLPRVRRSVVYQKARHYDMHVRIYAEAAAMGRLTTDDISESVALAHLAIRHAHQELANHPQMAECYRILGRAYEFLMLLEGQTNVLGGGSEWTQRRYLQAINAYRQAVTVEPADPETWRRLRNLFLRNSRYDLALEAQQHVDANLPQLSSLSAAEQRQLAAERRAVREAMDQVNGIVRAVNARVDRALEEAEDAGPAVHLAFQEGCILRALELIEALDEDLRFGDPAIRLFEATLHLDAGHTQQAFEIFSELEEMLGGSENMQWRGSAALANVCRGDFLRATGLWADETRRLGDARFDMVMGTLPLAVPPPESFRLDLFAGWPVDHTRALQLAYFMYSEQRADALFNAALTYLEIGQTEEANRRFEELLADHPDTALRPLVRLYYRHSSGSDEAIDPYPPIDRIPLSAQVFAPEPDHAVAPVEAPQPAGSLRSDKNPGHQP